MSDAFAVTVHRIITPRAAAWLWGKPESWMRRLALDGKLPFRRVKLPGRSRWRAYSVDALIERWGKPDPDKLGKLIQIEIGYWTDKDGAIWRLYMPRPSIETEDGEPAFDMPGARGKTYSQWSPPGGP